MDRLVRWLRGQSRIAEIRPDKDKGVPPWIVGSFERLLAFVLVMFDVQGAYTLLAIWTGAKLAASWHRFPVTSDEWPTSPGRHNGRAHSWYCFCRDWSFSRSYSPLGLPQMRKLFSIACLLFGIVLPAEANFH